MLETYYGIHNLTISASPPPSPTHLPHAALLKNMMQRLETFGALALVHDIARHNSTEQFYDLDDEFVGEEEEVLEGNDKEFEAAKREQFYVLETRSLGDVAEWWVGEDNYRWGM